MHSIGEVDRMTPVCVRFYINKKKEERNRFSKLGSIAIDYSGVRSR